MRTDPVTGTPCVYVAEVPGDPTGSIAQQNEVLMLRLTSAYPLCSNSPRPPARPSPAALAQMLWEDQMILDKPTLEIDPGWAITGKDAFLEIGGPPTQTATFDVFGSTLTITATVTGYTVDWGDGTIEPTTSPGGPWPHGDVRHAYTTKGYYTVRVRTHWTATWSMPGAGGTVTGTLFSENTIPRFRVEEIQAVRDR